MATRAKIRELLAGSMTDLFDGFMIEWAWQGGWPQEPGSTPQMYVTHGCGWRVALDRQAYLPDVINGPVADHRQTGCTP